MIQAPKDLQARQAALDISQSWIVQAPAGSGKTGVLVYRMLKLLAVAKQPEEVLAITFTRKAAKEMRDRLLSLLQSAANGETSDDAFEQQGLDLAKAVIENDRKHTWQLFDLPHRLNIETIDAFCARLVATMPWLSRLGDKPNTTEKPDQHFQYAIEQLLLELLDEESDVYPELRQLLLSQDNNFRKIRALLLPMLARRDQWLRHFLGQDLTQSRASLEEAWQNISSKFLQELVELTPIDLKEQLVEFGHFSATQKLSAELDKSPHQRKANKLEFPSAVFIDQKRFPRADFSDIELWQGLRFLLLTGGKLRSQVTKTQGFPTTHKEEKEQFKSVLSSLENHPEFIEKLAEIDHIPPPRFSDVQWQQLLNLEKVLRRVLSHLQLRFHNSKECDFSEVSLRANQALEELGQPTDLALRMDYQIQHILVDEFQDTSHAQFMLLNKLTKGWQRQDGRTLFLVGDPMQSIYRFREADVGLFVKLSEGRAQINDIQLQPLVFSENFRSQKQLVDWFNQVFAASFPAQNNEISGAIKYSLASSQNQGGLETVYQAHHDHQEEAAAVVSMVNQALVRGDKKIAILVRSRPHLKFILPALQAANIAYDGIDIKPLNNSQDVIDAINLCKAVVRLDDKVAWLGLLRGPWLGLSLAEISKLSIKKDVSVWSCLTNRKQVSKLSASNQQRIQKFTAIMQQALAQKQQVPLAALVQWLWQQLGGEYCLQSISHDDMQVVWQLIQDLDTGGDIEKISDLDKALDGLYAQAETSDAEQKRVVVSTIHKSKGLEYDTVILPGLSRKGANEDRDILRWAELVDENGHEQLLLAALEGSGAKHNKANSHYLYLTELEKQRGQFELLRLMYVACTRAKKQLVLSGVFHHNKAGELTSRGLKQSLLNGVWAQVASLFKLDEKEAESVDQDSKTQQFLNQQLYRLPKDFTVVTGQSIQRPNRAQPVKNQADKQASFDWATSVAQSVGIVLHDWLEHQGQNLMQTEVDKTLLQSWRIEFIARQLEPKQVASAVNRMSIAIAKMQKDPHAHWLFADTSHSHIENEYALTSVDGEGMDKLVQNHRIDRTFVDKEGVRWIIDYKSTTHFDDDVDAFVDEQLLERGYVEQLNRYAKAFSYIENRPIKLGVYFPLLSQWREWDYS
jgi:ATP-dependent helicase/nuclease subunit A